MPGKDVWLTIDAELQNFAAQRLGDESAACVVMDVTTAMSWRLPPRPASTPTGSMSASPPAMARAHHADHKPLLNKAISGTYPPGSTFKTAMALAAVDNGMDDLRRRLHRLDAARRPHFLLRCVENRRPWPCAICSAASRSPATSSSMKWRGGWASTRWPRRPMRWDWARPPASNCRARQGGLIPSRAWKMKRYGVAWQQGDTLSHRHRPGLCHSPRRSSSACRPRGSRPARRSRRA